MSTSLNNKEEQSSASSPTSVKKSLKKSLETYQTRIEKVLLNQFELVEQNEPKLLEAMKYSSMNGGKRIRPFLVYAVGEMLGATLEDLDGPAAAIELIHCYSLIHDDLPAMDDDDLRRGKPTCHKAFDEATAILAGDSLQTLAFEIVSSHAYQNVSLANTLQMVKLLSKNAGYSGMCGGQSLDIAATNKQVDLAALEQIHALKTGALIEVSALLGAYTNNLNIDDAHIDAIKLYAQKIGLAFQVQDDILDITSTTEQLGKPQGSDLEAEKSTYPALLGLSSAQEKAQALIDEALQALAALPYNTDILCEFAKYIIKRKF